MEKSVVDGGFADITDVPDNMPGDAEGLVISTLARAAFQAVRRVIGRSFGLVDNESVQNTSAMLKNISIHFRSVLAIHVLYDTTDVKSAAVKAFVEDVTLLGYAAAKEVEVERHRPSATAEAEAAVEAEPLAAETSIQPQKMAEFFAKIATNYCRATKANSEGSANVEALGDESSTADEEAALSPIEVP
ncbi:uncharacterized protein ACA1_338970 [Acanthamoeba castellanii str. Neff]|uniref:Uncharacterized protein n=1 Tax=Acanthamoeba castellanii (strain ATCC 30010 / Neff) TaxID=1257118 RepID=L8H580_ACACF|nr:uncharacterized protein ACA1_338970 [Acanthamoeba castellanii str. Neff]ELR20397.1 hypothetical protein ACA1_338970 [Acanthamoeba castellanii str. Neff]